MARWIVRWRCARTLKRQSSTAPGMPTWPRIIIVKTGTSTGRSKACSMQGRDTRRYSRPENPPFEKLPRTPIRPPDGETADPVHFAKGVRRQKVGRRANTDKLTMVERSANFPPTRGETDVGFRQQLSDYSGRF